jgi:phosphate transport system permease protein
VIPFARSGIIGAVILGLGRALGETMAVTMVIGNKDAIPAGLFDQTQTIASKIATSFSEASVGIETSSLIALGLVLLVLTIIMNVVARLLVWRVADPLGGK